MTKYLFLDLETFLITKEQPFPKPVCLSWCYSDKDEVTISDNSGNNLEDALMHIMKLTLCEGYHQVWHNGYSFDLPVIWTHFPCLRNFIVQCLDAELIHDTLIRERLYSLSTSGDSRMRKGKYSLEGLTKKYIGKDISKFKVGSDIWRLRYGELDGIEVKDYPPEALKYAVGDVQLLRHVFNAQEKSRRPFGPGSMNTEGLQIKAGLVLSLVYSRGLKVNADRLLESEKKLDEKIQPIQEELVKEGFSTIDRKGRYVKLNKKFMEYLETTYPEYVTKTYPTKTHPEGQIKIDDEGLSVYPEDQVINLRKELSNLEKYKNTYIKNIKKSGLVFKEQYDILKDTGRSSSFVHTMPKSGGIREIFEPRPGFKLVDVDYSALESCSMAQVYKDLGLSTGLIEYLGYGDKPVDYHAIVGSAWYNKVKGTKLDPIRFSQLCKTDEEAKKFRILGKPAGLSFSGGVGPSTLTTIAKSQGVEMTLEDSIDSLRLAEESIPGLVEYRGIWRSSEKGWLGSQLAVGSKKIGVRKNEDGEIVPKYTSLYGYEVNGRWRNNCTYCGMANGLSMQSPAADGAKEALWDCFKECMVTGSRILAFIHDEILFEVPEEIAYIESRNLAEIMCKGMKKILKDVRITTEFNISDYWTKDESKHLDTGVVWVN